MLTMSNGLRHSSPGSAHSAARARWTSIAIVVLCLVAWERPALADKWSPPTPRSVVSPNGEWSASMIPGVPGGVGARISVVRSRRSDSGEGWARALVNRNAPVDMFVSDSGSVVTLGEWHSEGYEHSIVIYDSNGKIVVDQRLEDFLAKDELGRTKQSVSSRWWRYRTESPEFVGDEFSLTTSWGSSLRFDVRTGRLSREDGRFGRFRRYCDGMRPAQEVAIYISRVWKESEHYTGRHCDLRRDGATCRSGGGQNGDPRVDTKIAVPAARFDQIIKDAAVLAPYIVDDGTYEYDRSFIHLRIVFGESIPKGSWAPPNRGDTYRLKYKPTEVAASAREWTKRVEALAATP